MYVCMYVCTYKDINIHTFQLNTHTRSQRIQPCYYGNMYKSKSEHKTIIRAQYTRAQIFLSFFLSLFLQVFFFFCAWLEWLWHKKNSRETETEWLRTYKNRTLFASFSFFFFFFVVVIESYSALNFFMARFYGA